MKLIVRGNGFTLRMNNQDPGSIKRLEHPMLQALACGFEDKKKRGGQDRIERPVTECVASEFENDERLRARAVIWLANQMALPAAERLNKWPMTGSWKACGTTPDAFFCESTSNSIRICLPELWNAIKNGIRKKTPDISSVYLMAAVSVEATRLYYKGI